jgi:hypothetical protein
LNAICRNFPQNVLDLLKGDGLTPDNKMCTTIFCVSSCLKKLSKFTEQPPDRCPLARTPVPILSLTSVPISIQTP